MRITGAQWRGFLRRFSRQQLPSCELNTVDDFFERHLDAIAEAMKPEYPVTVVHSRFCSHGKRQWLFSWRWPFVQTWISTSVCICGINEILRGNREMQRNIDDIVAILDTLQD